MAYIGQEVKFVINDTALFYKVKERYLQLSTNDNDRVFTILGVNKHEFCSKAYGYEPETGTWPEYRSNDMEAAQRVIDALNEKISGRERKPTMTLIKESFIQLFLQEPEKSFRKAGITNGDGILTSEGREVFETWLLKKHGDDFKKEVVDPILAEQEKKAA